jgi:hypothetical protein
MMVLYENFMFLLSMNEVNIKYTDFVISKKIFFIDFLDELGLFIKEKPIFTKKKFRHPEKFGFPLLHQFEYFWA